MAMDAGECQRIIEVPGEEGLRDIRILTAIIDCAQRATPVAL